MTTVKVFAPAKINLTLHVTGQRDDGYHLLDSLVAFADVGDWLIFGGLSEITDKPSPTKITVSGPERVGVPNGQSNLIAKALTTLLDDVSPEVRLEKNLPSSSGIGGGSADAAATLRAIISAWNMVQPADPAPDWRQALAAPAAPSQDPPYLSPYILEIAKNLGADVPMCLVCRPCRVTGIGENLTPVKLPKLHAVLVNPRVPVATPPVFKALDQKNNLPMPDTLQFQDAKGLIDFLTSQRNDLQAPAISIAPVISDVLPLLRSDDTCRLARMSGSGATCFGLFEDEDSAKIAAQRIKALRPDWWVRSTLLGDMSVRAKPVS